MLDKLLRTLFLFFLCGLLFGYMYAQYSFNPYNLWNKGYYIWDKTKDILAFVVIYSLLNHKLWKIATAILTGFLMVRLAWEILELFYVTSRNEGFILFGMFIICLIVILLIVFLPQIVKLVNKLANLVAKLITLIKSLDKWIMQKVYGK